MDLGTLQRNLPSVADTHRPPIPRPNAAQSNSEALSINNSNSHNRFSSPHKTPNASPKGAMRSSVGSLRSTSVDCMQQQPIPCLTTTSKKQMTVRALFDYDPSTDTGLPGRGLAFQHGDILHVVNATDHEWWQARRLILQQNGTSGHRANMSGSTLSVHCPLGIIPSRQRIERRQRSRLKHVNFFSKVTVIGSSPYVPNTMHTSNRLPEGSDSSTPSTPNGRDDEALFPSGYSTLDRLKKAVQQDPDGKPRSNSLTRNFLKRFSSRNRRKNDQLPTGSPTLTNAASDTELDSIRSYELVKPVTIRLARPLLVFGPLKERVSDNLLHCPNFATCVPHTSRPPRPGERDGVDYHFVPSKAQMEDDIKSDRFIEVGQFQDHFYATSIDSVRRTLESGRVCVLDLGLASIRRLELAGLYPITVLLKPLSVYHLRNMQHRLTEDQAKRALDLASRLEAENWRLFSAIITFETIEDAVNKVKQFVQIHNGPVIWVPSRTPNSDETESKP